MAKNFVAEFKRDRTSTSDEPRSGWPKMDTASNMIAKVQHIVLEECRVKLREIGDIVEWVSHMTVSTEF